MCAYNGVRKRNGVSWLTLSVLFINVQKKILFDTDLEIQFYVLEKDFSSLQHWSIFESYNHDKTKIRKKKVQNYQFMNKRFFLNFQSQFSKSVNWMIQSCRNLGSYHKENVLIG